MTAAQPPVSRREVAGLIALVAAIFAVSILTYFHLGEDAFISLRYSRNFAAGHGLVYNPGEWVEGYSNLLWVLVMAPFEALGLRAHVWARLISTACFAALAVGGWWMARRLAEPDAPAWQRWWLPAAIALEPLLHYHDDQGLETVPYAALLGGVLWMGGAGGAVWLGGALAAMATLTRPEGIAFALVLAPVFWLAPPAGACRWRRVAIYAAIPIAAFALQMLLRQWLYGEWVPNTVIAKRDGGPGGALQVGAYVATRAGLPLLALAGWAWALAHARHRPLAVGCLLTGATAVAFQLRAGGLLNVGFRYLAPLFVPVVVGCWLLVMALARGGRRRAMVAGVALILAMPVLLVRDGSVWLRGNTDAHRSRLHHRLFEAHTWNVAERTGRFLADPIFINAEVGRWADANLPHDALLGADQMGMFGYHARQPIIDLLGLMDAHIAHHGASVDYLAARAPRYLVIETCDTSRYWPRAMRGRPHVALLRDLAAREDFQQLYRPRWFLLPNLTFARLGFMVYVHRDADDGAAMEVLRLGADDETFERAWRVL